ncbi:hypothetical protein HDU93_000166 [Gonapodya sp. JEL0774]|nr:hypothetical protein HDU93_000166 [Gonapodya sp. JEL0774]
MTPNAEVLAMTGAGDDQTPLLKYSAATNGMVLNTIWDYNVSAYSLLNVSAATIYAYAAADLSTNFKDTEFTVEDFMFQVTSYTFANYKWIIVSGAPSSDYLGDTLILQKSLADRLWSVQRTIIIIAVVIVAGMSAISVLFTEIFISKPLCFILEVIAKENKALVAKPKSRSVSNTETAKVQNSMTGPQPSLPPRAQLEKVNEGESVLGKFDEY